MNVEHALVVLCIVHPHILPASITIAFLCCAAQDYIALLQSPKPGSDAFKAMYASALEGQEEAARNPVVR
jgi:hypothetical protein